MREQIPQLKKTKLIKVFLPILDNMRNFTKITSRIISFILMGLIISCATKEPMDLVALLHSQEKSAKETLTTKAEQNSQITDEEGFTCQKEEGDKCWQFQSCRNVCEELFFNNEQKENCYNWPMHLFEDFIELIDTMERGLFQQLEPEVFQCFLKITEGRTNILFRKFSKEEAKEFLEVLSYTYDLTFHLEKADGRDFFIFNSLFRKINHRIPSAIKKELRGGDNFLILLNKYENQTGWMWLNNYITHRCRIDSKCKEPLDYYCEILKDVQNSDLNDVFENRKFKNEYQRDVESKTCGADRCEYGNIQDFDEMCSRI